MQLFHHIPPSWWLSSLGQTQPLREKGTQGGKKGHFSIQGHAETRCSRGDADGVGYLIVTPRILGCRWWVGEDQQELRDLHGRVCPRNEAICSPRVKTFQQWKAGLPGLSPIAKKKRQKKG